MNNQPNKLITNYKAISRSDTVEPASSEMWEGNTIDSFKTDVPEEYSIDKQKCCTRLYALITNPDSKGAAIQLVTALLEFKQERHSSKSAENTQENQLKSIEMARSALCQAVNDREVPSFSQLCILIKNSSYFIQRNLPTTFKNFIQKLINDHILIIEKTDKLYTFLIDSGVECVTPLLKGYNDLSRGVSGYTEGCANIVCDHLSELIKNPQSRKITLQLVEVLLLFKQERYTSKSTKEVQEELLYIIHQVRNNLVQTVDRALAKEVPSFFQLCTLIKSNDYFIQKNLPTTFKEFIERLITTGILNIDNNPELRQFLSNSGVNSNYSLKIYNGISRNEVTTASTPYKDITIFGRVANKYKKGVSDKQNVCDQLFALIQNSDPATQKAALKLVEALLEFKQKRHSSKSVDNTEDTLFNNIKICWKTLNDIQKAQNKNILLLPDLLVLIKNNSSIFKRNLPTTFKKFIQKLIAAGMLKNYKLTLIPFLTDSGVNYHCSLKTYNDISRDEVLFASKYKKGVSDKQNVCDQLFALIKDSDPATQEAAIKLVEALLLFKQKRHSSKSVDGTEDEVFNYIKEKCQTLNDIQKSKGNKILLLPDLLVLIKNNSGIFKRNLPTTFKNFIQKLINDGNLPSITYNSELKQFLIDSGVKVDSIVKD